MATWIVGGLVLAAVVAIIAKMISDKRQGKNGCSCGSDCANCHGACSSQPK
jgi:hypothetical protein